MKPKTEAHHWTETTVLLHQLYILGTNRLDIILLSAVLALANIHLVCGRDPSPLVFFPGLVVRGQWWRIITHPFVHVSWYHFVLDAGSFMTGHTDRRVKWTGTCAFALLAAKVMIEAAMGSALFSDIHLGPIGQPIALSHAGGMLGGLGAWMVIPHFRRLFWIS